MHRLETCATEEVGGVTFIARPDGAGVLGGGRLVQPRPGVHRAGDHVIDDVVQAVPNGLDGLFEPLLALDALDGDVQVRQGGPQALDFLLREAPRLDPPVGLVLEGVAQDLHDREHQAQDAVLEAAFVDLNHD
jgi:hypothetical protein